MDEAFLPFCFAVFSMLLSCTCLLFHGYCMTTLPPDLLSVFRVGKRTSYIFTFNLKEKK